MTVAVTARIPTEPAASVFLGSGQMRGGALSLAGVQEDLIGVLHVWGSRVSVVCAPALLAKEQEKANSGLSNWKPDVGGRWMGLAVWSDLHLVGGAWKAQLF